MAKSSHKVPSSGIIFPMDTIFIVEDDTVLREELARLLTLQGYEPRWCDRFEDATQQALASHAACVVLDLKLPQADGLAICRDIRAASAVPIIMLTSSTSEFDEVMALGLGANDYVTKPYRPAVLLARIQNLVRTGATPTPLLREGCLTLDEASGIVTYQDESCELARNELKILSLLMRNAGKIVSRQQLMMHLWESDSFIDDNTLTVNMNRLRKRLHALGADEDLIKTKRGIGYAL